MRTGAKKFLGALAAVVTTAAFATSVFAADYASDPGYNNVIVNSDATSTEDIVSAIDTIKDADTKVATVEVKSTANLTVSASAIKALADKGEAVLELKAEKVTFAIDAATIEKVAKLNLGSSVTNTSKQTVITMKTSADFGCEVKAIITDCKLSQDQLAKAHLYLDGVDLGPVELNEDGYPVITMTRGGEYVIK